MIEIIDRCPLCGHQRADVELADISYAFIWRNLEKTRGVVFDPEVLAENTPEGGITTLWRCRNCSLRYFAPSLPGSPRFYEQLSEQVAYNAERWEFDIASRLLEPDESVADFGAGRGDFLQSLAPGSGRRVGVDHNPEAAKGLEQSGIEHTLTSFESFAEENDGRFDFVTAFHIIEHVASVDELIAPATRVLRPGGQLLISTPNARRYGAHPFSPLDMPPHHLSRWRAEQFDFLAERHGLILQRVRSQWVAGRRIPSRVRVLWDRAVDRLIGLDLLTSPYRRRGAFRHTMLAQFVKPGQHTARSLPARGNS